MSYLARPRTMTGPRLPALLLALGLTLGTPGLLPAQDHAHDHGPGERIGAVRFPVSCSPAAARGFEEAVAYLHSFWYERAGRAFEAVVATDSTCAMAHWGVAMSLFHPLWAPASPKELARGLAALERGLSLARTPRERDYLSALATYYRDAERRTFAERLAGYAEAMGGLHRAHPDDQEAAIFYGLALIAVGQTRATDTTLSNQRQALAILGPLFMANPQHPGLAHYVIHTCDSPVLARLGLNAARRYARIAPDVPHAQHMPSHIFTRLGLWEDVIASNARSAQAARQFEVTEQREGMWDQHAHALDYLVYGYLQLGREAEARRIVDQLAGVRAVFPPQAITTDYAMAAVPARWALERERWDEAMTLVVRPAPGWRGTEGITWFARAIGGARGGNPAVASAAIDSLTALEQGFGRDQAYWASQVRIQRLSAQAWVALARGDTTGARTLAAEAADLDDRTEKHPVTPGAVLPARELEGDLLLAIGQPDGAVRAYKAALARQPGRARSERGLREAERQLKQRAGR